MKKDVDGGTQGSQRHGAVRGQDATRVEIWIRPSLHPGLESCNEGKGSEPDGGLRALGASDVSTVFNPHLHLHCSPCMQMENVCI